MTTQIQNGASAPVVPARGALGPLPLTSVRIEGGFWGERQELGAREIIPHIERWLERVGTLANFDHVAAGTTAEHPHRGMVFADSDVYKLLEAMAWEVGRTGDARIEERLQALVARIAPAQRPDGYINTRWGNPGQEPRYSDLRWGHELYCLGHLFQAGVARLRTGHRDRLVDTALAAADHVCREFGPDGRDAVCGHPEVEMGLAELGRATGRPRYVEQAKLFVDRRGHGKLGASSADAPYFLDDAPVRRARALRGHAVRALYLAAGAIDVAVESGDRELLGAVRAQYRHALATQTYITGGMGAHHSDEGFGEDFELPPDRAYCETCAGIASIMTAWRLLLATGDLTLGDAIERTLYNVVATSTAADGHAFFYSNPLQCRVPGEVPSPDHLSPRAESALRAPWFECACCPPNVARVFARLQALVATRDATGLQLVQYVPGEVSAELDQGAVRLRVDTAYPEDGEVRVIVVEAPRAPWALALRVPGWARGATIERDGRSEPASPPAARISDLTAGEQVVLRLPVGPRVTVPDPRIDAVRGCVAVERGPLVLAVESVDLPGGADVAGLHIDPAAPPRASGDGAIARGALASAPDHAWPYATLGSAGAGAAPARGLDIPLIPYYRWGNRGPATMRVWIPTV